MHETRHRTRDDDLIGTGDLPSELAKLTGVEPPTQREVREAMVNARIPCERIRGRLYTRHRHMPAVLAHFRLTPIKF